MSGKECRHGILFLFLGSRVYQWKKLGGFDTAKNVYLEEGEERR